MSGSTGVTDINLSDLSHIADNERISVVIADGNRLFREGLNRILREEKSTQIVGEASNGPHTVNIVMDLRPDVLLVSLSMPVMDAIEVIPPIRKKSPKTKPLMLTVTTDEDMIFRGLKAGAKGYITKDAGVPELIKAIKTVHTGELWVERRLIARFFDAEAAADSGAKNGKGELRLEQLTRREQEVLRCLAMGQTNKEIAECLFISEKTVKSHLGSIFKKLKVSRRLQAILYAIRKGLT